MRTRPENLKLNKNAETGETAEQAGQESENSVKGSGRSESRHEVLCKSTRPINVLVGCVMSLPQLSMLSLLPHGGWDGVVAFWRGQTGSVAATQLIQLRLV